MTIEDRLEVLEKELKRTKFYNRYLLGAVMLAVTIGIVGATPLRSGKVIRANNFILEDANGKTRALLGMTGDTPALSLCDESGKSRAVIGINENGNPGFALFDSKNSGPRALLQMMDDDPSLVLFDVNGNPRAIMGVMNDDPKLELLDGNSKPIWAPSPQ